MKKTLAKRKGFTLYMGKRQAKSVGFTLYPKKGQVKSVGFTLIELVIYMGIVGVFMLILTDILVAILNTRVSSQSTSEVAQDGRYIYTRLIYDINRATSVSLPLNLGDSSSSLVASVSGITNTYAVSNGNLILSNSSGSAQLNSTDTSISGLTFKRIGNIGGKSTFQINFTVTSRFITNNSTDSAVFQTTAGLR